MRILKGQEGPEGPRSFEGLGGLQDRGVPEGLQRSMKSGRSKRSRISERSERILTASNLRIREFWETMW